MQFKDVLPTDVKDFLDQLVEKTKGYDVYLGGGSLRDTYYNHKHFNPEGVLNPLMVVLKEPKDLDIFFIPNGEIQKELPVLPKMYINYDILASGIPNVRKNVGQVRGVFMSSLSTPDVQFIVYDKHLSMQELAKDMDTNINQVMYNPVTQETFMTLAFVLGHEDKEIMLMHKFDTERMYNRVRRMSDKFPDYAIRFRIGLGQEEYEYRKYVEDTDFDGKKRKCSSSHAGSFIED